MIYVLCTWDASLEEPYAAVFTEERDAALAYRRMWPDRDAARWFIERQVPDHPEATEQVASSVWDVIEADGTIRGAAQSATA